MGRIYDALVRAEAERRAPQRPLAEAVDLASVPAAPEADPQPFALDGAVDREADASPNGAALEARMAALEVVVHALDDRLDAALPTLSRRLESRVVESAESIERQLRRDRDAATVVSARTTRRLEHALFLVAAVGAVAFLGIAGLLIWLR